MLVILTLNYNDAKTTIDFINRHIDFDIVSKLVVVDNQSTDNSYEKLCAIIHPKLCVIRTESNKGYGAGNNFGLKWINNNIKCKHVLLSNPDVIISKKTIESLSKLISSKEDAVVASPFMLNANGEKMPNTAFKLPNLFQYFMTIGLVASKFFKPLRYPNIENEKSPYFKVGAVSGSCFMLDLDKFLSFDGFDENVFLYCEEVIIGFKARNAGFSFYLLPNETFIHNHSVSISKTFNSAIKRQKLVFDSKLYVLKKYHNASDFVMLLATFYSKVVLLEYRIRGLISCNR